LTMTTFWEDPVYDYELVHQLNILITCSFSIYIYIFFFSQNVQCTICYTLYL
jgi:hypothetical protein